MDPVTVLIGAAALGFGIYTAYIRATNPAKLGKLDAMKKQWGEGVGTAVHVAAYSVLPVIFGIAMILAGMKGMSLFGQ